MTTRRVVRLLLLAALSVAPATTIGQTTPSWTQWGGPAATSCRTPTAWLELAGQRTEEAVERAARRRPLVDPRRRRTHLHDVPAARVASAVRRSQEEVVAALDAASGKTIWEFKYPSPTDGLDFSQGAGRTARRSSSATGSSPRARARSCSRSTRRPASALVARLHEGVHAPLAGRGYSVQPARSTTARSSSPSADRARRSPRSISRPARWCGRRATSTGRRRRRSSSTSTASSSSSCSPATSSRHGSRERPRRSGAIRTRPTGG